MPPCWHMTASQGSHGASTGARTPVGLSGAKTTHFLSLKGSRRNSGVPPRRSGRQTGSLCIVGHTLTKLPQSVLTPWTETLRPQAARGTAGACGCGRAKATRRRLVGAQTPRCAASKPSLLTPPPVRSDVQSRGRRSWWSLGPLTEHRKSHENSGKKKQVFCRKFPPNLSYLLQVMFYYFLSSLSFFFSFGPLIPVDL